MKISIGKSVNSRSNPCLPRVHNEVTNLRKCLFTIFYYRNIVAQGSKIACACSLDVQHREYLRRNRLCQLSPIADEGNSIIPFLLQRRSMFQLQFSYNNLVTVSTLCLELTEIQALTRVQMLV